MAKRAPVRRRPRKAKPGTKGLDPAQCSLEQPEGSAAEAAEAVDRAGGCVVGQYKEPLGGHPTLVSILPIDKIEPTPFQRDLSDTHHKRLADVINYERVPRFGGGTYHPILRRLEDFSDEFLRTALKQHEKRATMVLELEEKVGAVVKKLKERGLVSPYLRSFVVARINPLRWIKDEPPPLEEVFKTMRERALKFNVEKIKPQDLAGAAGPADEET